MFRFEYLEYLWLLVLVPLVLVLWQYSRRKKKKLIARLGDPQLIKNLSPGVSPKRLAIKFWLCLMALTLCILMLARPQMGAKISREKRQGIQTMICMDISNSMLCKDVAPSRLDKSKLLVEDLIDHFSNDQIGLVVFAGDAFIQLPITSDYVSAKMFLQNIDPSLIGSQGTDIGEAIQLSLQCFDPQSKAGKAIVIITDGEDHEGNAEKLAEQAQKQGVNVFVLGIGSTAGAPIPMTDGSYLKDRSGEVVMTKLNEQMCKQIAQAGKGLYIHVDNTGLAETQLNNEIKKIQQGDINSIVYSDYDEQFQAVALIILLLLIAETILQEKPNSWLNKWNLFDKK